MLCSLTGRTDAHPDASTDGDFFWHYGKSGICVLLRHFLPSASPLLLRLGRLLLDFHDSPPFVPSAAAGVSICCGTSSPISEPITDLPVHLLCPCIIELCTGLWWSLCHSPIASLLKA